MNTVEKLSVGVYSLFSNIISCASIVTINSNSDSKYANRMSLNSTFAVL